MQTQLRDESGFTLIDIAIIMLVVGLLAAPFIQLYNVNATRSAVASTQGNFQNASEAIRSYYFLNEYYPCPADPTLGPDDANFGIENRVDDGDPNTVDPCFTDNGDVNFPNAGDAAMWGALPHKSLKLNTDQTLDAWKNKLIYTVSTHQTEPGTYNATGALTALRLAGPLFVGGNVLPCEPTDDNNDDADGMPSPRTFGNMHLMLISSGETGQGGYSLNGNPINVCPAGANATTDAENCDRDTTFILPTCSQDTNAGASFYDDLILNGIQGVWNEEPTKIWEEADSASDMGSIIDQIGIGTSDPQHPVDVVGNIKTAASAYDSNKKGDVHASDYCDASGQHCFDPDQIADYDSDMVCSDDGGMQGIGSNRAKCLSLIPITTTSSCDDDEVAIGINASGEVICVAN